MIFTTEPMDGKKCISYCPDDARYQMDNTLCSATCEYPLSYHTKNDGSRTRFYCSQKCDAYIIVHEDVEP